MKEIKLEIRIHSLQYDELTPQDRELMDKAKEATSRSYAPYSKFSVGAAADQPVLTLAIAARSESGYLDTPIPPCGACRQVLLETEQRYQQPMRILLYGEKAIYEINGTKDLLPLSFGGEFLK